MVQVDHLQQVGRKIHPGTEEHANAIDPVSHRTAYGAVVVQRIWGERRRIHAWQTQGAFPWAYPGL